MSASPTTETTAIVLRTPDMIAAQIVDAANRTLLGDKFPAISTTARAEGLCQVGGVALTSENIPAVRAELKKATGSGSAHSLAARALDHVEQALVRLQSLSNLIAHPRVTAETYAVKLG